MSDNLSRYHNRVRFSQEYYDKADSMSLLDFVEKQGTVMKREGREYRIKEYQGRKIEGGLLINSDKNSFYWNDLHRGGGIVQFVMATENKSRDESIEILLGNTAVVSHVERVFASGESPKEESKPFALPEKDGNYRKLFAYLNKTRGIDYDTIKQFVELDKLYQSKPHCNCVFVTTGEQGEPIGARLKGTMTDKSFRGEVSGTNKLYPFCLEGETNRLYVYEADIDLMSDISLTKLKGGSPKPHHRISLGGTYSDPLFYYLEKNPQIDEIVFRLDNDQYGENGIRQMGGELLAMRKKVHILFPVSKDVNQDLQNTIKEFEQARVEDELETEL